MSILTSVSRAESSIIVNNFFNVILVIGMKGLFGERNINVHRKTLQMEVKVAVS